MLPVAVNACPAPFPPLPPLVPVHLPLWPNRLPPLTLPPLTLPPLTLPSELSCGFTPLIPHPQLIATTAREIGITTQRNTTFECQLFSFRRTPWRITVALSQPAIDFSLRIRQRLRSADDRINALLMSGGSQRKWHGNKDLRWILP